jgi:hypothetical protein
MIAMSQHSKPMQILGAMVQVKCNIWRTLLFSLFYSFSVFQNICNNNDALHTERKHIECPPATSDLLWQTKRFCNIKNESTDRGGGRGGVDIRMRGNQSRHLIEIRDRLNGGVLITHILNIKLSNEPRNNTHSGQIRRMLKQGLWNICVTQNVEFPPRSNIFMPMNVCWEMPNVGSHCAYYFCVSPYNDISVAQHAKLTISSICDTIRRNHPEFGNDWGVAYLLSKPLDFLNQINPVLANVRVHSDTEDDDDEEGEEEEECDVTC